MTDTRDEGQGSDISGGQLTLATLCPECGGPGSSDGGTLTLESQNYPVSLGRQCSVLL